MSSISVRFNSFLFSYSIFNEHKCAVLFSPAFHFFRHRDQNSGLYRTPPISGSRHCRVVGLDGLEPSTSRLSGVRSNHLSYKPIISLIWYWFFHLCQHVPTGGDDGVRTHDPLLAGQVLSQLSYTPVSGLLFQGSLLIPEN